jgi:putative membrane protein
MMGGFGTGMGVFGLFGGLLSMLVMLGLLAGLVFLGVWLLRRIDTPEGRGYRAQSRGFGEPTALEILQTRYARGELTREEYQIMLEDLG